MMRRLDARHGASGSGRLAARADCSVVAETNCRVGSILSHISAPAMDPGDFPATSMQIGNVIDWLKQMPAKLRQSSSSVADLECVNVASSANSDPLPKPVIPAQRLAAFKPRRASRASIS